MSLFHKGPSALVVPDDPCGSGCGALAGWGRSGTWNGAAMLFAMITSIPLCAQLEIPGTLLLSGQQPEDRQIIGLADPVAPDAALSLRSARYTAANFAVLEGSGSLIGTLVPAPADYIVGMTITVVPTGPVAAAATLELNGLGPRAIMKQGGLALENGDLQPQIPARLIYDGVRFQLISSTQLPCSLGFSAVNRSYCIADVAQVAASFFSASGTCSAQGARLCTIGEWSYACRSLPGFLGTVQSAEWVDHAANNLNGAKVVGAGNNGEADVEGKACEYGGHDLPTNAYRYRCCTNR